MGRRRYNTHIDLKGNRIYNEGTLIPTPLVGNVIDFDDEVDNLQTMSVGLASTFTTANLAPGRRKELLITTTALLALSLSFPAAWKWYGSRLTTTILSKEIRLRLVCYGTTDSDVRAEWTAQI